MSKRRQAGDVVYKVPGAGFCGEGLVIEVGGECERCLLGCGDKNCCEWSDCLVIEKGGYCYHVSECQMEDVKEDEDDK